MSKRVVLYKNSEGLGRNQDFYLTRPLSSIRRLYVYHVSSTINFNGGVIDLDVARRVPGAFTSQANQRLYYDYPSSTSAHYLTFPEGWGSNMLRTGQSDTNSRPLFLIEGELYDQADDGDPDLNPPGGCDCNWGTPIPGDGEYLHVIKYLDWPMDTISNSENPDWPYARQISIPSLPAGVEFDGTWDIQIVCAGAAGISRSFDTTVHHLTSEWLIGPEATNGQADAGNTMAYSAWGSTVNYVTRWGNRALSIGSSNSSLRLLKVWFFKRRSPLSGNYLEEKPVVIPPPEEEE